VRLAVDPDGALARRLFARPGELGPAATDGLHADRLVHATSIATLPSRTSILEPSRVTLWRQALVRPSSRSVGTSHIDQNVWRSTPATATSATPSISSSA